MKDYIKMVSVLTAIAALCGLLLAAVKKGTEQKIEVQILNNVQGPAVKNVLADSTNNLIEDRKEIVLNGEYFLVFIGIKEDKPWAIAFESSASGFGGNIGVMVGFHLENNQLTGIGILSHKETPGLGARITEAGFTDSFKNKPLTVSFKVKKDNGVIDAISGASISSKAVCLAVQKCVDLYPSIKKAILNGK